MGLFDRKASKIGLEGAHVLTDKGAAGRDIARALKDFLPDYNLLGSYNLKLSGATNKFADLIGGLMHKGRHSSTSFVRDLFLDIAQMGESDPQKATKLMAQVVHFLDNATDISSLGAGGRIAGAGA